MKGIGCIRCQIKEIFLVPCQSVNFTLILGVECEAISVAVIQAGDGDSAHLWTNLHQERENDEDVGAVSSESSQTLKPSGGCEGSVDTVPRALRLKSSPIFGSNIQNLKPAFWPKSSPDAFGTRPKSSQPMRASRT